MALTYHSTTPYAFAFNDPVAFNDPTGADPDPLTGSPVNRRTASPGDGASQFVWDASEQFGFWHNYGQVVSGNNDLSRISRQPGGGLTDWSFSNRVSGYAVKRGINSALNSDKGGSVDPSTGSVSYYESNYEAAYAGVSYTVAHGVFNQTQLWGSLKKLGVAHSTAFTAVASRKKYIETQTTGNPIIFIEMLSNPNKFDRDEYLNALQNALLANGFGEHVQVTGSSITDRFLAWWNNSPTATVTIKDFRLGQDRMDIGGYSYLNDPGSIIIYNGLHHRGKGKYQPTWKYVNATLHELGHALFGFEHDSKGFTDDPYSVMDYRSALRNGAGFNSQQQIIIMESIWGNQN